MGAIFASHSFKASDTTTLKNRFNDFAEEQCREYGDDYYSGHMGRKSLQVSDKSFKTAKLASEYLENYAEKSGPAIAVKVGDFSKVFPVTATEKKEVLKLNELKEKFQNWEGDLVKRARSAKSTQSGCKKCGSKIAIKFIKNMDCPVCGDNYFIKTETDLKAYNVLRIKLNEQNIKVTEMAKKYEAKNKDNFWYVGAWCAS